MTTPAYTATPCRASLRISTTSADANHQDVRWAKVPKQPEPPTVPTSAMVQPAVLAAGVPAPASSSAVDIRAQPRQFQAALEVAPDPSAQQDRVAILRLIPQPSGQQQHPEPTLATQEGSQDRERDFSAPVAADELADHIRELAPSTATPGSQTRQDELAGAGQPVALVSGQEPKPEPIRQPNLQDRKPVAGVPHADHAHRGRIDRSGIQHRPIRQAQR
jgi:hypothetical protein